MCAAIEFTYVLFFIYLFPIFYLNVEQFSVDLCFWSGHTFSYWVEINDEHVSYTSNKSADCGVEWTEFIYVARVTSPPTQYEIQYVQYGLAQTNSTLKPDNMILTFVSKNICHN